MSLETVTFSIPITATLIIISIRVEYITAPTTIINALVIVTTKSVIARYVKDIISPVGIVKTGIYFQTMSIIDMFWDITLVAHPLIIVASFYFTW